MSPDPSGAGGGDSPPEASSDRRLVQKCLRGDQEAWEELVARYKNLVFSIAVRKGLSEDEAADVFQRVWIQAYSNLSSLRKQGSVRSWLISVTLHECYHWARKRGRRQLRETPGMEIADTDVRFSVQPADPAEDEEILIVQQAIAELPPRCQELIRLLFYEYPSVPYKEVAARLGLAVGSIGFIRGRCLKKLHKLLERRGLA